MNTFLTNQLEDIKNNLDKKQKLKKRIEIASFQGYNVRQKFRNKLIETETEIETLFQTSYKWASEELKFLNLFERNKMCYYRFKNAYMNKEIENRLEELSKFISEIERMSKDNGVTL